MPDDTEVLRELAMEALGDGKATDVRVLDVRELTDVTDYMIVASGRSSRQVSAIAQQLVERAKAAGHRPMGVEGLRDGDWVLVDLCDVVVHVMLPDTRELYQLEKLWMDTERRAEALRRASREASG